MKLGKQVEYWEIDMKDWPMRDARSRFGTVVDAALAGEPQRVTRRGQPAVVVIAVEEYERLCKGEPSNTPTFVEHLLAIPKGGDFDFERQPLEPRPLDL